MVDSGSRNAEEAASRRFMSDLRGEHSLNNGALAVACRN